jgi:hypothetical protein
MVRRQVLAQDALGDAIDILVMACRVLAQSLERLRLKSYLSGYRRHRRTKFTVALSRLPGRVRWCGWRQRGAHLNGLEGQAARQAVIAR